MTLKSNRAGAAAALALTLALGACGGGGVRPTTGAPAPAATSETEIDAIAALLDQGDAKAAEKRVTAALKRDPMNPSLMLLRDSIARDPKELLGPVSYPYIVRDGETMTGLAERFLGNRLKAYQLARYNAVEKPAALAAGQTLRIPGEPKVEAPVRRAEPAPSRPSPTPRAKPAPKAAAATPRPATPGAPSANPGAARQARAAGLAALNQGRVGNAVGLLRRAAALDPANPVIAHDLARAQRIAANVQAHR